VEQPGAGRLPVAGHIFGMSETPLAFGPAPALGADNVAPAEDDELPA
jgi:hypothetical protein